MSWIQATIDLPPPLFPLVSITADGISKSSSCEKAQEGLKALGARRHIRERWHWQVSERADVKDPTSTPEPPTFPPMLLAGLITVKLLYRSMTSLISD
jgi:hypothetical protein